MADAPLSWVPLESNPEALTKYSRSLGLTKGEWVDVYGFDEDILKTIPNPKALILLFAINSRYEKFAAAQDKKVEGCQIVSPELFYMKQTVRNACGTIAIIHALANNVDNIGLADGPLKSFLEKTKDMSPEERGKALESFGEIAHAHEDCASEGQTATPNAQDDVDTHFACWVEKKHHVYELDGRRSYPINHGWTSEENWFKDAAKSIEHRILTLEGGTEGEYRFSVLALSCVDGDGGDGES